MPLVNLQTDLKSLKYGQDRPDGGSSDQPYITTDVSNPTTTLSLAVRNPIVKKILTEANKLAGGLGLNNFNVDDVINQVGGFIDKSGKFDDGFVRGGAIGATDAALTDTLRIAKFLTDAPKGPLFIARQIGLQLTNPKIEFKRVEFSGSGFKEIVKDLLQGDINNLLATATGGILEPTRVYNLGINTLAQVPVNAIGGHIVRHGVLPIQNEDSKYENVVEYNNRQSSNLDKTDWRLTGNRLVRLSKKFELGDREYEASKTDSLRKLRKENRRKNRKKENDIRAANRANEKSARDRRQSTADFAAFKQNLISGFGSTQGKEAFDAVMDKSLKDFGFEKIKFKKDKLDTAAIGIDTYFGGPGSVYGIGWTSLNRSSFTEDKIKIEEAFITSTTNAGFPIDISDGKINTTNPNQILVNRGIGTEGEVIKKHPDVANIDISDVIKGIGQSPQFSSYQEIFSRTDSNKKGQNVTTISQTSGSVTVNQFSLYTTTKPNGVDNAKSNYSTDNNGSIGYKNDYGDIVELKDASNKSYENWDAVSRENRTGDFGSVKISGSLNSVRADSINLTPPFFEGDSGKSYFDGSTVNVDGVDYNIQDLVNFRIQSVSTNDPSKGTWMVFRSLLTSFSDNVSADWNDISYAGRGNKFYIYKGFTRKIQVGFKIAALSAYEMKPIYTKLNFLMSSLMPDYDDTLMRGALHRITVGNYLDSQLGIITSLSYTVPNDSPWEVSLSKLDDNKQLVLPHILEVSMDFTPIGAETKGENKIEARSNSGRKTTFLAQNNGSNKEVQYY